MTHSNSDKHMTADHQLNETQNGGNDAVMNARHDRERTRLTTILSLLGLDDATQIDAAIKLDNAIQAHPDGVLVLTHGPVTEPSEEFRGTFETLVAMSWQDREDGAEFTEFVWSRT